MSLLDNDYIAGVYWSARKEAAAECSERIVTFLETIRRLHRVFEQWFETARTPALSEKLPIEVSSPRITELLEEDFAVKTKNDASAADLGFRLSFWNLGRHGVWINGNVNCGSYNQWLCNGAYLDFSSPGEERDRLVKLDLMTKILKSAVQCWEPDKGIVTSRSFRKEVDSDGTKRSVGWLTYVSRQYGEFPSLPHPVTVETVPRLGGIIVLSPEPPSEEDQSAIQLARTVYERCDIGAIKLTAHK